MRSAKPSGVGWSNLRARIDLHTLLAAVVIVSWAILAWTTLRPHTPTTDWNGWRQADTATIALNQMLPGSSILKPRINWGGNGPGYVETEFQLYTWLAAALMGVFGRGEWAGQLLSAAAICTAAVFVWLNLKQSYGKVPAIIGLLAFFGSRSVPFLGTAIQPDALAVALFAASWFFWSRFVRTESHWSLVAFGVFGSLAMLVKPSEAHLGVGSFIYVLLANPKLLRKPMPWITWAVMVCILAAYLVHGSHLYREYGNTFGVLSGGETKFPTLAHLRDTYALRHTLKNILLWGTGYAAVPAGIFLAIRRRLDASHWALAGGILVLAIIAFRYTSQDYGNYYFVPGAVLGAHLVAAAVVQLEPLLQRRGSSVRTMCLAIVTLVLAAQVIQNGRFRIRGQLPSALASRIFATGQCLARHATEGDLVVVRSPSASWDPAWRTAANYEDPRIFYLSQTRGWVLEVAQPNPDRLAAAARAGARFFADPMPEGDEALEPWLATHAKLVEVAVGGGRIWRL